MPIPSFPTMQSSSDLQELINAIEKHRKELEWLLQNLDDTNVKHLTADVIDTGTLNVGAGGVNIVGNIIWGNGGIDNPPPLDWIGAEGAIAKGTQPPESPTTGQLWVDSTRIPYVIKQWNGSSWVKATPTTADEVSAVAHNQTDVFNTLTNNGLLRGLFMSGGELYMNADYINAGTIRASLIDTTNLYAERIYQQGISSSYGKIGGSYGEFQLYYNNSLYFSIYNGIDYIDFNHKGSVFLTKSASSGRTVAKGAWDFSSATVTGIDATAKFG